MSSGKIKILRKIIPVFITLVFIILFPFVINEFESYPMLVIIISLYYAMTYGTRAALIAGFGAAFINLSFLFLFKTETDSNVWISIGLGSLANLSFSYFAARVVNLNRELKKIGETNDVLIMNLREEKAKILRQNETKAAFLANLSHEIRTPLAIVANMLEQMKILSNSREDYLLDNALQQNTLLIRIFDDIMNAVRIEQDDVILEKTPFSLLNLIRQLESDYSGRAEERNSSFTVTFEDSLPDRVLGDEKILQLTLNHLIDNAFKFSDNGKVSLVISGSNSKENSLSLSFRITDTGPGIAESEREHVFDFYTQSDISYSKHYQGMGTGLPLSRHYARMLDGDLILEKTGDCGSVFLLTVNLGLIDEEVSGPLPLSYPGKKCRKIDCRGISVLVVEDNDLLRHGLEQNLMQMGCKVLCLSSGHKFEEVLRSYKPELIFMDIQMPGRSGLDLIRSLRNMEKPYCEIFVIAFSAYVTATEKNLFFQTGVTDFLGKPYRRMDLENILVRLYPRACISEEENVEINESVDCEEVDETVRMIKELFVADMPAKIEQLRNCIKNQNYDGTSKIIHSCINNLAAVRQDDLCARGRNMEALARQDALRDDSEDWHPWLDEVSRLIERIAHNLSS